MDKKIFIILALLLLMYIMCKRKVNVPGRSPFGAMSQGVSDVDENDESQDNTFIFYAPWWGYCKKSMDDFNQASNKNSKIRLINSDQNPDLVKKYNVKGFPTIIKSNGQIYSGDRSTSSILDFADS